MEDSAIMNNKINHHELHLGLVKQTTGFNYIIHTSNDCIIINSGVSGDIIPLVLKDGKYTVDYMKINHFRKLQKSLQFQKDE